jgi:hypothetical protein
MPIVHFRVRHRPALLQLQQGNRTLSREVAMAAAVAMAAVAEASRTGDSNPRK